jgi:hypothetical protein
LADVCNRSLWKMSSLSLSGVAVLLRVTVAVPVRVATLPTDSLAVVWAEAWSGACAGADVAGGAATGGAGTGAGVGAGWICANSVEPAIASGMFGQSPASTGEGIAKTFVVPANRKQRSHSANEGRCRITIESRASNATDDIRLRALTAECRMNASWAMHAENGQAPHAAMAARRLIWHELLIGDERPPSPRAHGISVIASECFSRA